MSEPAILKAGATGRRAIGVRSVVLGLMLGACSASTGLSAYVPPSAPSQTAVVGAVVAVAASAKLADPIEVSPVRPTDHGPGSYVVCIREANPPPDNRPRYYAIFFDDDEYKGARLSVIMDACETQTFSRLPAPAPAQGPKVAKPKHAKPEPAKSKTQGGSAPAH